MDDDDDDRAYFLLLFLMRKSLPRNAANITPATEEKLSVVSDDLTFNPIVLANSRVWVATLCAPLTSLMK
jgi:hypothetical protein